MSLPPHAQEPCGPHFAADKSTAQFRALLLQVPAPDLLSVLFHYQQDPEGFLFFFFNLFLAGCYCHCRLSLLGLRLPGKRSPASLVLRSLGESSLQMAGGAMEVPEASGRGDLVRTKTPASAPSQNPALPQTLDLLGLK